MSAIDIPVIDISSRNTNAASQLLAAAANNGFVFIKNNDAGVEAKDIESMFNLSREFFQSPTEVKEECSINSNKSGKNQGWLSMHTETLDPGNQKRGDFKEAFNIGEYLNNTPQQPFPAPLQPHATQIGAFQSSCHALCNRILTLFATALSIEDSSWFTSRHDRSQGPSGSVLRLLYYPSPSPSATRASTDIRAGAHSDYGSITLLFQLPGQPGLEILTRQGEWAAVPVNPSGNGINDTPSAATTKGTESGSGSLPILVNIGDLLDYWTNGLLKSTVHRVIFPKGEEGRDRYSIAYFCHPIDEAELVAVPSELVRGRKRENGGSGSEEGGMVLTAKDHLNQRLAATYGIKGKDENGAA